MDPDSIIEDLLDIIPEEDEGNFEYKRSLVNKDKNRILELSTQMRYRMEQGEGECRYLIGVDDDGSAYGLTDEEHEETTATLKKVANMNDYSIRVLKTTECKKNRKVSEFLIRENNIVQYKEIRIAVAGNVDSGKSSSIGCLITGEKDNGRGSARAHVLKFSHELESGRTSSVSQQIIGYDPEGNVVNHDNEIKNLTWPEIVKRSSKIVTFFDLCGHAKYAKTTVSGLVSNLVDYAVIAVGANMGVKGSTREHIKLCNTFRIPIVVFFTKTDICKDKKDVANETFTQIKKLFNLPGDRRRAVVMKNIESVLQNIDNVKLGTIVPIFPISNVTLEGHPLVHEFFNLLEPRVKFDKDCPMECHIDSTFFVKGIGTVLGGMLKKGIAKAGEKYYLGPFNDGSYKEAKVRTIHVKRALVNEVDSGRYVCFSTPKIDRMSVKKGMVLLDKKMADKEIAIRQFKAEVIVFKTHHTTIKVGYHSVLNVNSLRTTVELIEIVSKTRVSLKQSSEKVDVSEGKEEQVLSLGDRAIVVFKLIHRPCYFSIGDKFSMSEGHVKVAGVIREIL